MSTKGEKREFYVPAQFAPPLHPPHFAHAEQLCSLYPRADDPDAREQFGLVPLHLGHHAAG